MTGRACAHARASLYPQTLVQLNCTPRSYTAYINGRWRNSAQYDLSLAFKSSNLPSVTSAKLTPEQLAVVAEGLGWLRGIASGQCSTVMGCTTMRWPSLKMIVLVVLAAALVLTTSPANGISCANVQCVDVSTPICKVCHRRAGKRTENYAWKDDRESNNLNDRGLVTSECYLDEVVGSLPHELQEQVFEVLELVLDMNR